MRAGNFSPTGKFGRAYLKQIAPAANLSHHHGPVAPTGFFELIKSKYNHVSMYMPRVSDSHMPPRKALVQTFLLIAYVVPVMCWRR